MRFAVENAQLLLLLFSFTEVGGGGALPLLVQLLLQLLRLLLLLQLVRSTTQNVHMSPHAVYVGTPNPSQTLPGPGILYLRL